jgi:hypothetical protein
LNFVEHFASILFYSFQGVFAEFLKQYVSEKGLSEDLVEDPQIIHDLEEIVGSVPEINKRKVSETSDNETEPGVRKRLSSRHV